MSQAGYTPISLYYSTTASAVPTNTNLANGELAINITDGKLYYKNNSGTVTLLATAGTVSSQWTTTGSDIYYNTGNVGIGTSSPSFKLQVEGAANSAALTLLRLNNSGTTGGGPGIASRIAFTAGATALGYIQGSNFASGAAGLQFSGDGTNAQATLDASGNLGLGVTPSAWGASWKSASINTVGAVASTTGVTRLYHNAYNNDTNNIYRTTAAASMYSQDGSHSWFTAASGTAGNAITFTQAMTLDASGNLGIGTSSPSNTLDVNGTVRIRAGNTLYFQNAAADANATISASGSTGSSNISINAGGGNVGIGETSPTTTLDVKAAQGRIKLTSSTGTNNALVLFNNTGGNAYVGLDTSGGSLTSAYALNLYHEGAYPITFSTNNTERFRIASNGAWGLSGANYGSAGQVLTSQGSGSPPVWASGGGGSSQWTTSGSNIYYNTGNVGIGSANTPSSKLDISGFASTNLTGIALAITDAPSVANAGLQIAFRNSSTTYSYASIGYSNEAGASAGALLFYTNPSVFANTNTERMRIDSAGRVGIATTAQTSNLARLQVTHDANSDRYGVYVPGGSYVGSGPSGTQYGGYFVPQVSNSSGSHIGVYGSAGIAAVGSSQYGGYFTGVGSASTPNYGVYGVGNQSDNNGPAVAYGGYFSVTTSNPSAGGSGGMVPVRAESLANKGSVTYAIWASTLPGPTTINGYYYEHNNALQCRIKSNGGIDNYSANNTNLSDRREKKDFAPAKSYLDTICAIPVQTFLYIDQQDDLPNLGVVAQDVQAVAPELVVESNWAKYGEEERMRLSVYETDLVYALMKSIQELNAKFEEYKASHP